MQQGEGSGFPLGLGINDNHLPPPGGIFFFNTLMQVMHFRMCDVPRSYRISGPSWKWQPTPVFLPRESHGQKSLVGYNAWGRKESAITEHAHIHTYTHTLPPALQQTHTPVYLLTELQVVVLKAWVWKKFCFLNSSGLHSILEDENLIYSILWIFSQFAPSHFLPPGGDSVLSNSPILHCSHSPVTCVFTCLCFSEG